MRAGPLRHAVNVQLRADVRDDSGGVTPTWLTVDMVRASIEPLSGRERLLADQVQGDVSHRVRIRYWSNLTPKHRIQFGSRSLNIVSIRNTNERNREMELLCNEEV